MIHIQEQQKQQQNDDGADSDTSSLGGEEDSFRILYNAVKSYRLGAQSLIDPFMKLPNRRFHQDYYEEIQRPIAMSLIKNHIKVITRPGKNITRADDFACLLERTIHAFDWSCRWSETDVE